MKYNTLDLDYCSKDTALKIIAKIKQCKRLLAIAVKPSISKGYHIMLLCNTQTCDICRFVYDDPRRFDLDFGRPESRRNVLFDNIHPRMWKIIRKSQKSQGVPSNERMP